MTTTLRSQYIRSIEEKFVALTGNNDVAAVLRHLIHWCDKTQDYKQFVEENKRIIDQKLNFNTVKFEHGWIYKTSKELAEEMFLGKSRQSISRILDTIVKNGWAQRRHNLKYILDRTWQYRINIPRIIFDLQVVGWSYDGKMLPNHPEAAEISIVQNEQCIDQNEQCNAQDEKCNAQNLTMQCSILSNVIQKDIQKDKKENNYINIITKDFENSDSEKFAEDCRSLPKIAEVTTANVLAPIPQRAVNEEPPKRKERAKSVSTLLDESTTLTPEWKDIAAKAKIHPDHWDDIFTLFFNYYTGGRGANAKMKKWDRCWQNWCLQQINYTKRECLKPKPPQSVYESCVQKLSSLPFQQPQEQITTAANQRLLRSGQTLNELFKQEIEKQHNMGIRKNV